MALAVLSGGFADAFGEQVDQRAAGGVSDLIGDFRDGFARAQQQCFGALDAGVDDILLRRESGLSFEQMGEIKRTEVDLRREALQRDGFTDMGADIDDGLVNRGLFALFVCRRCEQELE